MRILESCIPICNLQEVGDEIFQINASWADAYHIAKDNYEQQYCFQAVNPSIIPPKVKISIYFILYIHIYDDNCDVG